jgi:hypothetical protein
MLSTRPPLPSAYWPLRSRTLESSDESASKSKKYKEQALYSRLKKRARAHTHTCVCEVKPRWKDHARKHY